MKYTKVKVIRISEEQHKTLVKMKSYNVDVGNFIREAITDKINKEYSNLIPKAEKEVDSFSASLKLALSKL
jgi:predicted CopG family antitoxin